MTEQAVDMIKVYQVSQWFAGITGILGPVPDGKKEQCVNLVKKQKLTFEEFEETYKMACSLIVRMGVRLAAIGSIALLNDFIKENFSEMVKVLKDPVDAYDHSD